MTVRVSGEHTIPTFTSGSSANQAATTAGFLVVTQWRFRDHGAFERGLSLMRVKPWLRYQHARRGRSPDRTAMLEMNEALLASTSEEDTPSV